MAALHVHALLPHALQLVDDLFLDHVNWRWVHCLTIPVTALNTLHFSQRPYKWIRYAIGVVVGAEGDLSFSPDSPRALNYNASLSNESASLYYHIPIEERPRMFPIDPKIRGTRITSTFCTPRRTRFRRKVAQRDGWVCPLSGVDETLCDAVHLVAHSKGDAYISAFTQHRSRVPAGGDVVHKIDSIRNGLFLNKFTHLVLGQHVAFIPTPNFAMGTNDIISNAPPSEKRFTAHLFQLQTPSYLGDRAMTQGSPLQISQPDWPPNVIFDALYASAVLHHFGTQASKDNFNETWEDTYYPGGTTTAVGADHKMILDNRAINDERLRKQAEEHLARYEAREANRGPGNLDILWNFPISQVPLEQRRAVLREAKEKRKAREHLSLQERVGNWRQQISAMYS